MPRKTLSAFSKLITPHVCGRLPLPVMYVDGNSEQKGGQVWEQLQDKEEFLEHLCLKGGMSSKAWQDPKTKVEVYEAEVFGENDFK